jgi:hypothetical protein
LPIIARTPEKQREVQERIKASQSKEANGSRERQTAAVAASPVSATNVKSPQPLTKADVPKPGRTPIAMHIQEIPPFGARKPPAVVIPPTAAVSVPKAAPEEPTTEAPRAKLNPTASSFVFKPSAAASRFQPVRCKDQEGLRPCLLTPVPSIFLSAAVRDVAGSGVAKSARSFAFHRGTETAAISAVELGRYGTVCLWHQQCHSVAPATPKTRRRKAIRANFFLLLTFNAKAGNGRQRARRFQPLPEQSAGPKDSFSILAILGQEAGCGRSARLWCGHVGPVPRSRGRTWHVH